MFEELGTGFLKCPVCFLLPPQIMISETKTFFFKLQDLQYNDNN